MILTESVLCERHFNAESSLIHVSPAFPSEPLSALVWRFPLSATGGFENRRLPEGGPCSGLAHLEMSSLKVFGAKTSTA